jgi:hypothetical protein
MTLGKVLFAVYFFAECYTRQTICLVFNGLCPVPLALDEAAVFSSEWSMTQRATMLAPPMPYHHYQFVA